MIPARPAFLLALTTLVLVQAKQITFINRSPDTIWVGCLGNDQKPPLDNGGWEMSAGAQTTKEAPGDWAGRFWARTGCGADGRCVTGDCGGLQCAGRGGAPPVSLVEITFNGDAGKDFYDVSLVDGANMPCSIAPAKLEDGGDRYSCKKASCDEDLNGSCPKELQQTDGDRVVGCKSACLAFNTDQYCCRNAYGTPDTCDPNEWPTNYAQGFKSKCPDAYSYAYDDTTSTFTCSDTDYTVTFG